MSKSIAIVAAAPTVKLLNGLCTSATNTVKGMGVTVGLFTDICGATPSKTVFQPARRAAIVGFMVGHYVNAKSTLTIAQLRKVAEVAYDGRETHKRKMTSEEESAYNSGKSLLTGLCKAAGVANPSNNAGGKNKGRKPRAGGKGNAKGKTVAKVPAITNDNDLRVYVADSRRTMLAVLAKASQGKGIKNETSTAIADAMAILAKIAPAS